MHTDYDRSYGALARLWPLLIIAGLAVNLRPMMTATGPLLGAIHETTGLGLQSLSLLTVLPMFCMGVFPLLLPWLGWRFRETVWIQGGLLAIALGNLWRFGVTDGGTLIASTVVAGTGVAVVQALAPGVVKRWYSANVPLAMGVYSASLMAGGGLAATVSPIVADYYDSWQWGLGVFALPAVLAILLWHTRPSERDKAGGKGIAVNFFRNRRAWLLAGYFGLANGGYACMIAWLPSFAQELGWSAQDSGDLIGVMTVFQVMAALGAPALSAGRMDRRPWLLLAVVLQLIGFSGLVFFPEAALTVWVALIGAGLGACFSLTLTVALDHLSHPGFAGALTAFVQGIGFMITATVPYLAGALHELTGSFYAAWVMLLMTLLLMLVASFRFNPSGYKRAMGHLEAD